MDEPQPRRLPYVASLDGLRGLAVAAVLAYHAGFWWGRGGFLGVDAFFVLSGYLITALLLAEYRNTAAIDLRGFWLRRARRLLPALLLVLGWVAIYAAVFARPDEVGRIRADAVATVLYVANWRPVLMHDSYFAQFATPSPLLHTWSLAIEEQWYLVWPLVLLALLRLRRRTATIGITVLLAAGSAGLMAWLYRSGGDPSRVYYGTDTRAQSLLIGAVLAMVMARVAWRPSGNLARWLVEAVAVACLGAVVVAWSSVRYTDAWLYRGGLAVLALAVAIVIGAAVLAPRGLVASALSSAPLRRLGVISYGVYLWHWPLFVFLTPARVGVAGYGLFAVRVVATLIAATASYHLVEMPVRRGRLTRAKAARVLGPVAATTLAAFLLLATRGGAATGASASNIAGTAGTPPATVATSTRVLVVGDSVAFTAAEGLSRVGGQWNLAVWNEAKLGCGILRSDRIYVDGEWKPEDPGCNDWASRWAGYVDVFRPDVVVVLAGTWDVQDREVAGQRLTFGSPQFDAFALSEIETAIHVLSSRGARVVLLTAPRYQPPNLALAGSSPRFDVARIDHINALYAEAASADPRDATLIDLAAFVDRAGGAASLTVDGVHFNVAGGNKVGRWLAPQLSSLAASHSAPPVAGAPAAVTPPPRWDALLGLVADTPESRAGVVMNDYARFRAAFDVPLPRQDASDNAVAAYYRALLFGPQGQPTGLVLAQGSGIGSGSLLDAASQRRLLGLAADAWTLRGPTRELIPTTGTPSCVAGCTAPGGTPSLAGDERFALLAAALAETDTYTAFFSSDTTAYSVGRLASTVAGPDADAAKLASVRAALAGEPALRPFEAYATGEGVDAGGQYTAVVLLQSDGATAQANAELLRQRIASGTSWLVGQPYRQLISSADVRVEGRLVIARLRASSALLWFALPAAGDTLLLHH